MSARGRNLAAVIGALLIAACSLRDFAGFSSGDDGDASGDGAAGADVVDALDARDDDAAAPGPSDAASDAPSAPFCATRGTDASFCEDFDAPGGASLARFSSVHVGSGTITIDDVEAASLPRSLLVAAPANATAGASSTYAIIAPGNGPHTTVRLEAALRVDEVNNVSSVGIQVLKLWFFSDGEAYEVGLGLGGQAGGLFVFEYRSKDGYYKSLGNLTAPPIGAWTRLALDVRLAAGASTLSVDRDGARVLDAIALSPASPIAEVEAAVGLPYGTGPHSPWRVRLDDVLLHVK